MSEHATSQRTERPPPVPVCRLATPADREQIYRLRHAIFAEELGQHETNAAGRLVDSLDEVNVYLVVARGERVRAFISLTPPDAGRYSIDKYLARDDCQLPWGDGLWEMRLLSVVPAERGGPFASILLFAGFRWIEEHGGRSVVLIGRADLLEYYRKFGVEPTGHEITSGRVRYALMQGTVEHIAKVARTRHRRTLTRLARRFRWALPFPWLDPGSCEHGGAFFTAIGPRFDALERRREIVPADVLDAWFPPAPGVIDALTCDPGWLARTSPPTSAEGLAGVIADTRRIPRERIVVGSGSSDLIFRAFSTLLRPGMRALVVDPSYGEYEHVLRKVLGLRVDRLTLRIEEDLRLDPDRWADALAQGYDLAVLVNPANPSGQALGARELHAAIARAPQRTLVWLDETYAEYAETDVSLERQVGGLPRLVICKSMSKIWALSGLRVGWLVAPEPLAIELRARTPPWPVSLPAQIAAVRALEDPQYYARRRDETRRLRRELASGLRGLGLHVIEGVINAVIALLPEDMPAASDVVAALRRQGIFVRDLTGLSPVFRGRALRIAVRPTSEQQRILGALANVLARRLGGGLAR